MEPAILTLNCGSSSVKFALFAPDLSPQLRGQVENLGATGTPRLIAPDVVPRLPVALHGHGRVLDWLLHDALAGRAIAAVGHRVVHGGEDFVAPVRLDPAMGRRIAALAPLAPLHQPHNLAGIDAATRTLPGVPQFACFDTAFHATIPPHRRRLPLPARFDGQGLRRYGFHGLSCESAMGALRGRIGERAGGRVAICHLGNGASVTAVFGGRSQWTSMGFTPLDGLIMGTRPGRIDPGAVLWLADRLGVEEAGRVLNQESGLFGVSGVSGDMRILLSSEEPAARLAVDMFVDRLAGEVAAAAAAIDGLDALVFTGGIGEHSAEIRARAAAALGFLGLRIDEAKNANHAAEISAPRSAIAVHVIAADEEETIARSVGRMLQRGTTFV
jgi:acetate kinase